MARFKPSPDGLRVLRAGMCPDCGAAVSQGMAACRACGLDFGEHARELPGPRPRAAAAPPVAPAAAPAPVASASAAPAQPVSAPHAAAQHAPATARAVGLSLDDIDFLERGPLRAHTLPLTDAEGPDVAWGAPTPLLGAALARAAVVVMAEAAVADDPLVLLGHPAVAGPVPRATINQRRADAAAVDDPLALIAPPSRPSSPGAPASTQPASTQPVSTQPVSTQPASTQPASSTSISAGLTLDDIERLERPTTTTLPHTFAELADADGAEPRLGLALTRGANVVMADAAVVDEPLVLLGYPPVASHVARCSIHLKRSDAAEVDDALFLIQRPPLAPARPPTNAPAAPPATSTPSGAPVAARRMSAATPLSSMPSSPTVRPLPGSPAPTTSSPRVPAARPLSGGPPAPRPHDPEATALLDNDAVRAAVDVVSREQQRAQPVRAHDPRRPSTSIAGRGGARSIDE